MNAGRIRQAARASLLEAAEHACAELAAASPVDTGELAAAWTITPTEAGTDEDTVLVANRVGYAAVVDQAEPFASPLVDALGQAALDQAGCDVLLALRQRLGCCWKKMPRCACWPSI